MNAAAASVAHVSLIPDINIGRGMRRTCCFLLPRAGLHKRRLESLFQFEYVPGSSLLIKFGFKAVVCSFQNGALMRRNGGAAGAFVYYLKIDGFFRIAAKILNDKINHGNLLSFLS